MSSAKAAPTLSLLGTHKAAHGFSASHLTKGTTNPLFLGFALSPRLRIYSTLVRPQQHLAACPWGSAQSIPWMRLTTLLQLFLWCVLSSFFFFLFLN